MPLQIWTPVRPHADNTALALGIVDAGRSIGSGLAGMAADMKRQQEEDKQRAEKAKQIRGMARMFAKDLNLSPADIESADANELSGQVMGYMKQEIMKAESAQRQAAEERLRNDILQGEDLAAQRRVPGLMLGQIEGTAAGLPSPLSNEAFDTRLTQETGLPPAVRNFIQAHAQAGAPLPPSAMDDILKQSAASGPDALPQAHELPGGYLGFTLPGTRNLDVRPDLTKQTSAAEELFDPDGNIIGHRVPIGGGKFTFRPARPAATGELLPVLDPVTKQPVPGFGMDASGKVHDFRSMFQKAAAGSALDISAPAKPTGTKDNPHTPKTPAEGAKVKKGEWLRTPDGRLIQRQ